MATPGRRSTRQSSRTSSPATRRGPHGPYVNAADMITDGDAMDVSADNTWNRSLHSSPARIREDQEARSVSVANGPVTPAGSVPRPRDRVRGKSVVASSSAAETGSRSSSRQRKPARIAEMIKQEAQESPIGTGPEEEDESAAKGPERLEESGDDDYTPAGKAAKLKKSRKSRDAREAESPQALVDHRTPEGQKQLKIVIDDAVFRSIDQDNELVAIALRRLYHRTLTDDRLADLLDNVLSMVATTEETQEFKSFIKKERKSAKRDLASGRITVESAVASDAIPRPKPHRNSESKLSKSASPSKPASPRKSISISTPSSNRKNQPTTAIITSPQEPNPSTDTPINMAVVTRRGARRQANSPTPQSPKKPEVPALETPIVPPAAATRNSRKRPSSTPEPSTKHNGPVPGTGGDEPPRKKAKLAGGVQSSSSSTLSDLSASSRETSTEAPDTRSNGLAAKGSYSSAITNGVRIGGNLKRKPEPAQKAKILAGSKHGLGLPDDEMESKKRQMRRTDYPGYEVQDSFMRNSIKPAKRRPAPPPVDVLGVYTQSMREQLEQSNMRSPASSSIYGDYLVPPPPGAARPSRSGTPAPGSGRKTARVKISPVKKKNAIVAGLGARAGGRDSPIGFRADGEDSDNVDYCVTCNESGELLCCDGCPRSFHFLCCDPPLEEENPPTGEWFCHVCENRRNPISRPPRGLFAMLIHDVNRQNASVFRLPIKIRNYFEGVTESEGGSYSYDDPVIARHRTRATGPTAEIEADNFKIKDSKGNFVLCTSCGKTSTGKREMIKCDHCAQYWHLDCLDPPPANPPVRPLENRPRQLWKCPAHADLDTSQPGTHKFRRPKNFKVVDTMLNRGHKNNGDIEIELESSDEESETELNEDGTVYRLTEKSIKLDFIERIKRMNEEDERRQRWEQEIQQARLEAQKQIIDDFNSRSGPEKNALGGLLDLRNTPQVTSRSNGVVARQQHTVSDASERIQKLVTDLVNESSRDVTAALGDQSTQPDQANGVSTEISARSGRSALRTGFSGVKKQTRSTTPTLAPSDRRALETLQKLISKRLGEQPSSEAYENGAEESNGVD